MVDTRCRYLVAGTRYVPVYSTYLVWYTHTLGAVVYSEYYEPSEII